MRNKRPGNNWCYLFSTACRNHQSSFQAAGKNIANPVATILSAAMLLESLNLLEEAKAVRDAVNASLDANFVTEDISKEASKSTSEVGDWIAEKVKN